VNETYVMRRKQVPTRYNSRKAARKFEFIINLKTAKPFGPTIPQSVLFRAAE
jgi:hypothetical protein